MTQKLPISCVSCRIKETTINCPCYLGEAETGMYPDKRHPMCPLSIKQFDAVELIPTHEKGFVVAIRGNFCHVVGAEINMTTPMDDLKTLGFTLQEFLKQNMVSVSMFQTYIDQRLNGTYTDLKR